MNSESERETEFFTNVNLCTPIWHLPLLIGLYLSVPSYRLSEVISIVSGPSRARKHRAGDLISGTGPWKYTKPKPSPLPRLTRWIISTLLATKRCCCQSPENWTDHKPREAIMTPATAGVRRRFSWGQLVQKSICVSFLSSFRSNTAIKSTEPLRNYCKTSQQRFNHDFAY